MEMWTRNEAGEWRRWPHVAPGLDAVASAIPRVDRVLVVGRTPVEDDRAVAAIRLSRRLAGGSLTVIAGQERPTRAWREAVCAAGADSALVVARRDEYEGRPDPPLDDAREVGADVCPELHVVHERGVTLSVCGRHRDSMVLARHHLDRWCLAAHDQCPHWCAGRGPDRAANAGERPTGREGPR
jgi:hypothetical protein